ncbi:asparaginyl-tRNA synthetase [Plesiocystis pacifica SIR-1]|uniref:Asparagine--tRNA ligase n=1 Tax=Plesiocystis pacifica SIR-1 TaxID=391625 RepID=A6G3U0_9BACT|nr:asparagine--tRNA ligase [Plesiocystis pacifica]EDM79477.1 asparaginyl-tRNA synthetase [Plesiocystis pacifica SIR-1]
MQSPRTKIAQALQAEIPADGALNLRVKGWARTVRSGKKVTFISLNDGSSFGSLQVVVPPEVDDYEAITHLTTGSALSVEGELIESPAKGQRVELKATKVEIVGKADPSYPLQKKRHGFEFLREQAHLRVRTNTFGAVFRVRSALAQSVHRFFGERGFYYIHTPIITASDTEGAGEMFRVTTLPVGDPPRDDEGAVDDKQDFFAKPTFLTVSGQLNGETFALGLSDIYTFGPTFRAENSNTSRHASEFWMIEPEMAWHDLDDDCQLAEDFVKAMLKTALEDCAEDLAFFDKRIDKGLIERLTKVAEADFARITYTEAVELLEKSGKSFEFPVEWGKNLQAEHERYITEEILGRPTFVVDYPKEIKAFYMRRNDDGKTVAAMDLLVPKIGELIGGSQREERLDVLESIFASDPHLSVEDYDWYLDTRRFGTAPHAGFGLGFERLVMYATGMENIRDVIPFPRTPRTCEF